MLKWYQFDGNAMMLHGNGVLLFGNGVLQFGNTVLHSGDGFVQNGNVFLQFGNGFVLIVRSLLRWRKVWLHELEALKEKKEARDERQDGYFELLLMHVSFSDNCADGYKANLG